MISYIVDRIEEHLIVLVDKKTYKVVIKKDKELPKVVPGDVVYYNKKENKYTVNEKERAQRLKNIRAKFNSIWNDNAFTLIELLAVIIILGILMLIAIPSVTNYINNSRKNSYVSTIDQIIKGTIAKVNSGDLNMFDTDTTYYVPCTCIKLENGEAKSPYGKFDPAYVVVTFDGTNYNYYFTGKDVQNMGVPVLTSADILSKESIVANVDAIDTTVGIEGTSNVYVFSDECNGEGEIGPAGTTVSGGSTPGGSGSSGSTAKYLCKRASTLHTETCARTDTNGCGGKYSQGNTISYGNLGTKGSDPVRGDAYDCDVNNDGKFDSNTERFYYITSRDNKAVLIYYSNISNGETSFTDQYAYATKQSAINAGYTCTNSYGCNDYGPLVAYEQLPSNTLWKNTKIIKPGTRGIYRFNDEFITNFDYKNKVARFPTKNDIIDACNFSGFNMTKGSFDNCNFLLEAIKTYSNNSQPEYANGYLLENPYYTYNSESYVILTNGYWRGMDYRSTDFPYGVRPVVETLLSDIEK